MSVISKKESRVDGDNNPLIMGFINYSNSSELFDRIVNINCIQKANSKNPVINKVGSFAYEHMLGGGKIWIEEPGNKQTIIYLLEMNIALGNNKM